MDKELLIKVLSSSNRVIMPGFGVFLRKNLDEQLIFSPFLRNDDGFLVSVVQQEYSLNEEDAKEMVYSYVEHIKQVLVTKKRFVIDGVGALFVDENGAIAMVMDTSKQISPESKVKSVDPVEAKSEVVEEPAAVAQEERVVEAAAQEEEVQEEEAQEPAVQTPPAPQPTPQPIPQPRVAPVAQNNSSRMMGGARVNQSSPSMAPKPLSIPQPAQQSRYTASTPQQPHVGNSNFSRSMPGAGGFAKPRTQAQSTHVGAQPGIQQGGVGRSGGYAAPRGGYSAPESQPQAQPQQPQQQTQPQQQQPQPQQRPQQPPHNKRRRPAPKGGNNKSKTTDIWLTVAIIAALIVIGLMVFGILTAQESDSLML